MGLKNESEASQAKQTLTLRRYARTPKSMSVAATTNLVSQSLKSAVVEWTRGDVREKKTGCGVRDIVERWRLLHRGELRQRHVKHARDANRTQTRP